ncbi:MULTISPECIES: CHAT domain-containing protein [unclassified Moorena]|uniref:CHAT domain-containing protein n=1 Tax=unclassified Moorena TaxID=2683338 RepID=UPI0013BD56A2|nr:MULTISPECIES: CHAT domain-containing protein [unclassified Moorena]NER86854.1 CHAT domain-containing protein [Moorena sp. SIO3A2]NET63515.1 CHAT domain-containing protein [Moorena sp. SIO1G6]
MKRLIQFILMTLLGLILSHGVHALPFSAGHQPSVISTQSLAISHQHSAISNQPSALSNSEQNATVSRTQQEAGSTKHYLLLETGKQYYDAGQYADAARVLQQAAQAYQATGDILNQAQALRLLSLVTQQLGEWDQAQAAIDSSLSLLETVSRGGEGVLAKVLNTQGRLQLVQGNAEAALNTWQNAEALYAQANDRVGVLGSQINQAQGMQSLGLYRRAKKLLTQVRQTLLAQPDSPLKAIGLHNLGNVFRQAGDLEQSKQTLTESWKVAQRIQSPESQSQALLSLGNTERALATRAKDTNNHKASKQHIQEAITHYQQAAATTTSPITKIQAQLNQLSLLIETDQEKSVQALLPQIQTLLTKLPSSRASVYAHVNFAQSLILIRNRKLRTQFTKPITTQIPNFPDIAQQLNTAIEQAKTLEDKRAESYALGTLGNWFEQTKDWSNAITFTKSALLIAQGINAPDIAYQWQWQMGRLLKAKAEQATTTSNGDTEAVTKLIDHAIAYYTQASNTLTNLRSDLVALNPDIQFSFREQVEPVYRELVDLLLRSPEPSNDNLKKARKVIEALQLAEIDNFFRDACAKPEKVNIDNVDPRAAVIYPIILKDGLAVILKLPKQNDLVYSFHQNISDDQVDEAVKKFQEIITKPTGANHTIKKELPQIYDLLIRPFEEELETNRDRDQSPIKTLVFILDGSLRNIPVAALYDREKDKYLIERYAVAVTPGLQLVDPKPLPRQQLTALIAGATNAPSFKKEGLGPIDNVAFELTKIGEQVNRSQKLQNQEFIKENLQNQLTAASFNVVHIATHGQFSSNPEQTFILDWDERIKVKDLDNLLRMSDPSGTTPIELLLLSACQTATGDKRAALGLAGIAIRAGARSTLATLWQVNDASTAEFMNQFYQQLNNPQLTKAEALRNAQIEFLKMEEEDPNKDYTLPYHWAPFILVGNWL